jgi:ankyrin repeat protein
MASRPTTSPAAPSAAASADALAAAPAPPAAAAGDDHGARKRPHDDEAAAPPPPPPPPPAPLPPPAAAPFRGPAADSALGERFLDVIALVSANGFALDARPTRFLCGLTLREGARRADGSLDRAGFAGGPADMIRRALEAQAPWLRAARAAPRGDAQLHGVSIARTTSLIRAAAAGDERRVRELLAAGAPLRCVDSWSWSALHNACFRGSTKVVAALLEADASGLTVDALTNTGDSALIVASFYGHEDAVRLLLARGSRQVLQNENGLAALHTSVYRGHAGIVELLCAVPGAAAAVALRDNYGRTPIALVVSDGGGGGKQFVAALIVADAAGATDGQLIEGDSLLMWASKSGEDRAVQALIARGARQEQQNTDGMTALHFAAAKGHAGIVDQLCAAPGAAAAIALRDKFGCTPLVFAVMSGGGGERLVAALLAADASGLTVDAQSDTGSTALVWASFNGVEHAVRLLLARGARQDLQNDSGRAALHYAAEKGHAGVVEQLCAAPGAAAALTLRTKNGHTPLVLAVSEGGGGERLVAALLAADAAGETVNVQNVLGDTALIQASENGHRGAVCLLMARGARQELQNKVGWAAMHCAAAKGHTGLIEQLCAALGAAAALALRTKSGDSPLAVAVKNGSGCDRLVSALIAADATGAADEQLIDGNSLLIWASERGEERAVRALLARGARQVLQNNGGRAALHYAASKGFANVVERLCLAPGAGAAAALQDKYGNTPLMLAVLHGGGEERLVAALLAADAVGAVVNAQNIFGNSALILACDSGCEGAVRLLLARGAQQELQNKEGIAALHYAAYKGHAGIAECLCNAKGAATVLSLRTKSGGTPLALAAHAGHAACTSVLRAQGAS